jgi:hypothetical protein
LCCYKRMADRLRDALTAAGLRAQARLIESTRLVLPDDLHAWLSEAENVAQGLPNAGRILELVERARSQHARAEALLLKATVARLVEAVAAGHERRAAEMGAKASETNRKKAQKERGPLNRIIRRLAKREGSAAVLWDDFVRDVQGEFEAVRPFRFRTTNSRGDPKIACGFRYETAEGADRSMTLETFANALSKARNHQ